MMAVAVNTSWGSQKMIDEEDRAKKPDENYLQWQTRIAELDALQRRADGPIITPELSRQGIYADEFITHVETNTLARTKRNRRVSSLMVMRDRGQVTDDQYRAAVEIAFVAETIQSNAGVRSASLKARVDGSGSARDVLVERLAFVRLEQAYTKWRGQLPTPKRMVIDMVVEDTSLAVIARRYSKGWRHARVILMDALDRWESIREDAWRNVDDQDVTRCYNQLGVGRLL